VDYVVSHGIILPGPRAVALLLIVLISGFSTSPGACTASASPVGRWSRCVRASPLHQSQGTAPAHPGHQYRPAIHRSIVRRGEARDQLGGDANQLHLSYLSSAAADDLRRRSCAGHPEPRGGESQAQRSPGTQKSAAEQSTAVSMGTLFDRRVNEPSRPNWTCMPRRLSPS
jgi:hypothetical protein